MSNIAVMKRGSEETFIDYRILRALFHLAEDHGWKPRGVQPNVVYQFNIRNGWKKAPHEQVEIIQRINKYSSEEMDYVGPWGQMVEPEDALNIASALERALQKIDLEDYKWPVQYGFAPKDAQGREVNIEAIDNIRTMIEYCRKGAFVVQ